MDWPDEQRGEQREEREEHEDDDAGHPVGPRDDPAEHQKAGITAGVCRLDLLEPVVRVHGAVAVRLETDRVDAVIRAAAPRSSP